MTYQVLLNGEPLHLDVEDCVVHKGGEFDYNLDCLLVPSRAIDPQDVRKLFEVRVPGSEERLSAIASGKEGDGISLTFHLKGHVDDPANVKEVTLFWDEQPLGEMRCDYADPVTEEEVLALSRSLVKEDKPAPVALILAVLVVLLAAGVFVATSGLKS